MDEIKLLNILKYFSLVLTFQPLFGLVICALRELDRLIITQLKPKTVLQ